MSLGKCKFKKEMRYHYIYLLEWPKTLTTSNADEDVEERELSYIAGKDAKLFPFWKTI